MKQALIPSLAVLVTFAALGGPARAQVAGFSDVPKDHWAADSIAKLVAAGIIASPGQQQKAASPSAAKAPTKPAYNGEKPVTRYELAVTLYRFVQYIDRADKQKKSKMGAQAAPADGAAAVQRLIAEGYLPKNTPLATEGTKTVTANQLADAITHVIVQSRVKATPITPDSKYAPIERPSAAPGR